MRWTLLRKGRPIEENPKHLVLVPGRTYGRRELLRYQRAACPNNNKNTTNHPRTSRTGTTSTSCRCEECRIVETNLAKFLPRVLFRLREDGTISVKGPNAEHLVWVNQRQVFREDHDDSDGNEQETSSGIKHEWSKRSVALPPGTHVTLKLPPTYANNSSIEKTKSTFLPSLEFQVIAEDEVLEDYSCRKPQVFTDNNGKAMFQSAKLTTTTTKPSTAPDMKPLDESESDAPAVCGASPPLSTAPDRAQQQNASSQSSSVHNTPQLMRRLEQRIKMAEEMESKRACEEKHQSQNHLAASFDAVCDKELVAEKQHVVMIDLCNDDVGDHQFKVSPSRTQQSPRHLFAQTDQQDPAAAAAAAASKNVVDPGLTRTDTVSPPCDRMQHVDGSPANQSFRKLFFVPLGQKLSRNRIAILKGVVERKGAIATDTWTEATHLVVDAAISAKSVASYLDVRTPSKLAGILEEKRIQIVKPEWITNSGETLLEPRMDELWNGLITFQSKSRKRSHKKENAAHSLTNKPDKKIRNSLSCLEKSDISMKCTRKPRNLELSDLFQKLSKLHQNCPFRDEDEWKSYQYNRVSGRLLHLDFEVTDDPIVLRRTKNVKGIGAGTMEKIRQYFCSGTFDRFAAFEKDPDRKAMSAMMDIWGCGRSKALELIQMGCRTIEDVRDGVACGNIHLSLQQQVGVKCYEDFREKMDKKEVETIADIVRQAVLERFPAAQVTIMGSYRRRKAEFGDVDILIVHPKFAVTTPYAALGELVDRLRKRGHMSYHLTQVEGMTTAMYDTTDEGSQASSIASGSQRSAPTMSPASVSHKGHYSSYSYMGVFHSPLFPGKRRRIDIKFYPYRERAFAFLYFTGNGYFNRSMRLYSKRCKNMTLNDHGLFPVAAHKTNLRPSERLPIEASTEREVFDILELEYKEPHERLCFDDVIPKDPGARRLLSEVKDTELTNDGHKWID